MVEPCQGALICSMNERDSRFIGIVKEVIMNFFAAGEHGWLIDWKLRIHPSILSDGTIGVEQINLSTVLKRHQMVVL